MQEKSFFIFRIQLFVQAKLIFYTSNSLRCDTSNQLSMWIPEFNYVDWPFRTPVWTLTVRKGLLTKTNTNLFTKVAITYKSMAIQFLTTIPLVVPTQSAFTVKRQGSELKGPGIAERGRLCRNWILQLKHFFEKMSIDPLRINVKLVTLVAKWNFLFVRYSILLLCVTLRSLPTGLISYSTTHTLISDGNPHSSSFFPLALLSSNYLEPLRNSLRNIQLSNRYYWRSILFQILAFVFLSSHLLLTGTCDTTRRRILTSFLN